MYKISRDKRVIQQRIYACVKDQTQIAYAFGNQRLTLYLGRGVYVYTQRGT